MDRCKLAFRSRVAIERGISTSKAYVKLQLVELGGYEVCDLKLGQAEPSKLLVETEERFGCEDAAMHINVLVGAVYCPT